jgi:hypothetical protein
MVVLLKPSSLSSRPSWCAPFRPLSHNIRHSRALAQTENRNSKTVNNRSLPHTSARNRTTSARAGTEKCKKNEKQLTPTHRNPPLPPPSSHKTTLAEGASAIFNAAQRRPPTPLSLFIIRHSLFIIRYPSLFPAAFPSKKTFAKSWKII